MAEEYNPAKGYNDSKISRLRIASKEAADQVSAHTPLQKLQEAIKHASQMLDAKSSGQTAACVIYWQRMKDLRIKDNAALSKASQLAQEKGLPLIVLHIFSISDFKAHDRSPRRIDFVLRNLKSLQKDFLELNIPLHTITVEDRKTLPQELIRFAQEHSALDIFANLEYEIDELRRDEKCIRLGAESGIKMHTFDDYVIVPPGKVVAKSTGKMTTVFSPFLRTWGAVIASNPSYLDLYPDPQPNDKSIRSKKEFQKLFEHQIPDDLKDFECKDKDRMTELWPEGYEKASAVLDRFLHTKARPEQIDKDPLQDGALTSEKDSRLEDYHSDRSHVDSDTSSRLSPYLAAGVISPREVIHRARKGRKLDLTRDTGLGMWTQEVAWRDFYGHILACYPRVCMGRPFQEKFADVLWEVEPEKLQAWKDGMTGYPIVDAAMRQCNQQGWMHNRARMIAGMFLTKDLMIDWRLGEQYFMQMFIDGDFASNDGGWQWLASTGTDPQPYFRVFNPTTQSEKSDPTGHYIRTYVPELRNLKGKALHNPFGEMPRAEFAKLGYPAPLVDHAMARKRAIFRYKFPGQKEGDEPEEAKDGTVEKATKGKRKGQVETQTAHAKPSNTIDQAFEKQASPAKRRHVTKISD